MSINNMDYTHDRCYQISQLIDAIVWKTHSTYYAYNAYNAPHKITMHQMEPVSMGYIIIFFILI
jgi:hypothetical protein